MGKIARNARARGRGGGRVHRPVGPPPELSGNRRTDRHAAAPRSNPRRGRPTGAGILSDLEAFADCGNGPAHTCAPPPPLLSQRPLPLPLVHSQDRYRTVAGVAWDGSPDRSAPFKQASLDKTNLAGERPVPALVLLRNRRGDRPRSPPLLADLSQRRPVRLGGPLAAP